MLQSRCNLSCSTISVHINVWFRFGWQKANLNSSQSLMSISRATLEQLGRKCAIEIGRYLLPGCETNSVSVPLMYLLQTQTAVIHSTRKQLATRCIMSAQAETMRDRYRWNWCVHKRMPPPRMIFKLGWWPAEADTKTGRARLAEKKSTLTHF